MSDPSEENRSQLKLSEQEKEIQGRLRSVKNIIFQEGPMTTKELRGRTPTVYRDQNTFYRDLRRMIVADVLVQFNDGRLALPFQPAIFGKSLKEIAETKVTPKPGSPEGSLHLCRLGKHPSYAIAPDGNKYCSICGSKVERTVRNKSRNVGHRRH